MSNKSHSSRKLATALAPGTAAASSPSSPALQPRGAGGGSGRGGGSGAGAPPPRQRLRSPRRSGSARTGRASSARAGPAGARSHAAASTGRGSGSGPDHAPPATKNMESVATTAPGHRAAAANSGSATTGAGAAAAVAMDRISSSSSITNTAAAVAVQQQLLHSGGGHGQAGCSSSGSSSCGNLLRDQISALSSAVAAAVGRIPPPDATVEQASHESSKISESPCVRRPIEHKDGATYLMGGRQVLMGTATRSKVGGRMVAVSFPKDIQDTMHRISEEKVRKMRAPPKEKLIREYAYGYNGGCRRNLFLVGQCGGGSGGGGGSGTSPGSAAGDLSLSSSTSSSYRCVYNVAALGVVFDIDKNQQQLFGGHSTEVTAIAYNEPTRLCATGQRLGHEPALICIWSVDDGLERLRLLGHDRSLDRLEFSCDGRWLFSVGGGGGQDHPVTPSRRPRRSWGSMSPRIKHLDELSPGTPSSAIFVWAVDAMHLTTPGPTCRDPQTLDAPRLLISQIVDHILDLVRHPADPEKLLCCCPNGVVFLSCAWGSAGIGEDVEVRRPSYARDSLTEEAFGFSAATYVPSSDGALIGTEGGTIFIFDHISEGGHCSRSFSLMAGVSVLEWTPDGLLVAGGMDCGLSFFRLERSRKPELLRRFPLTSVTNTLLVPNAVQATQRPADRGMLLLVGTTGGEILRVDVDGWHEPRVVLAQKSARCEVWAMAGHPIVESCFVTGDVDGHLLFYDGSSRALLEGQPYQCQASVRCLAWDPQGLLLVCGLETGFLEVLQTGGWGTHGALGMQPRFVLQLQVLRAPSSGEPNAVNVVRFSPSADDGRWLACGCRDGRIVLFAVERWVDANKSVFGAHLVRHCVLLGNSSSILALQFSVDGTRISSNAKDGQLLAWSVERGERWPPSESEWFCTGHRFGLTMAWETLGIWNSHTYDNTTALVAESDWTARVMAVGDAEGLVKLHCFPLPITCSESRDYAGHCSHVSSLAWTASGQLLSVGAGRADCVIQWRYIGLEAAPSPPGGAAGAQLHAALAKIAELSGGLSVTTSLGASVEDGGTGTDTPGNATVEVTTLAPPSPQVVPPTCRLKRSESDDQLLCQRATAKRCMESAIGRPASATLAKSGVAVPPPLPSVVGALGAEAPRLTAASPPVAVATTEHDNANVTHRNLLWSGEARQAGIPRGSTSSRPLGSDSSVAGASPPFTCHSCLTATSSFPVAAVAQELSAGTGAGGSSCQSTSLWEGSPRSFTGLRELSLGAGQRSPSDFRRKGRTTSPWEASSPRPTVLRQVPLGPPPTSREVSPSARGAPMAFGVVRQANGSPSQQRLAPGHSSLPLLPHSSSLPSSGSSAQSALQRRTQTQQSPAVAAPSSAYSVRLVDTASGMLLASATVYLYHPPFALDAAVDYIAVGRGLGSAELFAPPPGWGVLRSGGGLLLWLSLTVSSLLQAPPVVSQQLRFEFEASSGVTATASAVAIGRFDGHVQLPLGEGLLNPLSGRPLHVRLGPSFDQIVKDWLSRVSHCTRVVEIEALTGQRPRTGRPPLPQPA